MSFVKKTLFLFVLILCVQVVVCQEHNEIGADSLATKSINKKYLYNANISLIDSIINFSKQYLGSPYRGGHDGPNSFDCSGFTSFVFRNFGVKLGRSSSDQAEETANVSTEDIAPGDLVFYNGHHRGSRVGHVGLVISKHENGYFDFIHAASSVGISISNSEADYYTRRFVKAGRVIQMDTMMARSFKQKSVDNTAFKVETEVPQISSISTPSTIVVKKTIPAKYHTVKSGETLSEIADKYGITVAQLKKKNHLKKDFLALKQRIKVKDEQHVEVIEKVKQAVSNETKINSVVTEKQTANSNTDNLNEQQTYHIVKKGETLFSISKQFGVNVEKLNELNGLKNGKIYFGQKLIVANSISLENNIQTTLEEPKTEKMRDVESENMATEIKSTKNGTHIVAKGETLQSISKSYGIKIAELKELNNMTSDNIMAGQKLLTPSKEKEQHAKSKSKTHTVKSGETLSEIAEKYHCTVRELKKWNNKDSNKLSLGEKLKIK